MRSIVVLTDPDAGPVLGWLGHGPTAVRDLVGLRAVCGRLRIERVVVDQHHAMAQTWLPEVVRIADAHQADVIVTRDVRRVVDELDKGAGEQVDVRRAERAELFRLADTLPFLVAYVDDAQRFRFVNRAYTALLGWTPSQVVGRTLEDVLGDERYGHVRANVERALAGERVVFTSERIIKEERRILRGVYVPFFGDDGAVQGFYASLYDITEYQILEEQRLAQAVNDQQRRRLESLGLLAGGVAHDFNNLLTGIQSNAEAVLSTLHTLHPLRAPMMDVRTAASRAAELTAQLLAFSGRTQFASQPVEVRSLVLELGRLLSGRQRRSCGLTLQVGDEDLWVRASGPQIRQVVMNLITNACDAIGDEDGLIVVQAGCSYHQPPGLRADDYVWCEVTDNGRGMDDELVSRIFEPFFTTRSDGHGLGLSAVQGIVRGHGGVLEVDSTPGVGTTMRIWLPSSDAPSVVPSDTAARTGESGWTGAVLIIDDQPLVGRAAARLMERRGFDVAVAVGGEEGVSLFHESPDRWTLVLVDVSMPDLDGPSVLARMRETRRDLPAILMSGFSAARVPPTGPPGLTHFLQKPLSLDTIDVVLAELLDPQASPRVHTP